MTKQQNDRIKTKLAGIGMAAAYLFLPYSITCMTIGAFLHFGSKLLPRKPEEMESEFIYTVLGAPILFPSYLSEQIRKPFREARWRHLSEQKQMAGAWIKSNLEIRGLTVTSRVPHAAENFPLHLAVEVPLGREATFQEVMTQAHNVFPQLSLEELYAEMEPLSLLDRAWAERSGFTLWAEEIPCPNCPVCNKPMESLWRIGEVRVNAAKTGLNHPMTYSFAAGGKKTYPSRICSDCYRRLGVNGSSTCG